MTMKKTTGLIMMTLLMTWAAPALIAGPNEPGVQEVVVPLTDPGRPVVLGASLLNGGIRVEGYDGNQVLVEVIPEGGQHSDRTRNGMRRIPNTSMGVTIEEQDNQVRVRGSWNSNIHLMKLKVPRRTSIQLKCINNGDIHVSGVEGELELQNTNGKITALDIDGWVVAHTTNGEIKVTIDKLQSNKDMSFVTLNGDVDVTFPPGLKADLKINAGNGEIFTDFEFNMKEDSPGPIITSNRNGGHFKISLDKEVRATIGGGGLEIYFKTWNGDILIRKSGN